MSSVEVCGVCRDPLDSTKCISANQRRYHTSCFVCHQCLQPFPGGSYMPGDDTDGKIYCEQDYFLLFGDRCARCNEFITDQAVTAMDMKWHIEHFTCEKCTKPLNNTQFLSWKDKPYCRPCHASIKAQESIYCPKCNQTISSTSQTIYWRDALYHAYHFTCFECKKTLDQTTFREKDEKHYCKVDFERLYRSHNICAVCRQAIQGRSICALDKYFHPEHFKCAKCEKTFSGSAFHVYQGIPYCHQHYNEVAGKVCALCFNYIQGKPVNAIGRDWCTAHFVCLGCGKNLAIDGNRFVHWDTKPMCIKCYDDIPNSVRRKLDQYHEIDVRLKKKQSKENLAGSSSKLTKSSSDNLSGSQEKLSS